MGKTIGIYVEDSIAEAMKAAAKRKGISIAKLGGIAAEKELKAEGFINDSGTDEGKIYEKFRELVDIIGLDQVESVIEAGIPCELAEVETA